MFAIKRSILTGMFKHTITIIFIIAIICSIFEIVKVCRESDFKLIDKIELIILQLILICISIGVILGNCGVIVII